MSTIAQGGLSSLCMFIVLASGPALSRPWTGNSSEHSQKVVPRNNGEYQFEHVTSVSAHRNVQYPLMNENKNSVQTEQNLRKESQPRYEHVPQAGAVHQHFNSYDEAEILRLKLEANETGANLTADNVCSGRWCTAWTLVKLTKSAGRKPHLLIIPLSAVIVFVIALVLKAIRWCNEDIQEADLKDMRYVSSNGDIVSLHPAYGNSYRNMLSGSWYDGRVRPSIDLQGSHTHRYVKNSPHESISRGKKRVGEGLPLSTLQARGRSRQQRHRRSRKASGRTRMHGRLNQTTMSPCSTRYEHIMEMSHILELSSREDVQNPNAISDEQSRQGATPTPNQTLHHGKHSSSGYVSDPVSSHSVSSGTSQEDLNSPLMHQLSIADHMKISSRGSRSDSSVDVFIEQSIQPSVDEDCVCESQVLNQSPHTNHGPDNPDVTSAFARDRKACDYTSSDGYENDFDTAIENCIVEGVLKTTSFNSFKDDSDEESQFIDRKYDFQESSHKLTGQAKDLETLQSFVNSGRCVLPAGITIEFNQPRSDGSSEDCEYSDSD